MSRLFHLHFHVPDVAVAAAAIDRIGLPPNARYGAVDGESVRLDPGDPDPDGFRFRLQDHQVGHVNITLTSGPRVRFDHLGVVTDAFDAVLDRARDAGWRVRPNERRTFLVTPWGFRVEVHPAGGRIDEGLGTAETAWIDRCELHVADPEAVRSGLSHVLGGMAWGDVRSVEDGSTDGAASVPVVELAGTAVDGGVTLRTASLLVE